MASQSSVEELAVTPSTPQPQDLELPSTKNIQRNISPSTSMMVAVGPSSARHSSSMTPPPSSQVPTKLRISPRRSTTPDATVLSSPPPTITKGPKKVVVPSTSSSLPSDEELLDWSGDELRAILKSFRSENEKLELAAREARMSAAHYKLQHNLLLIDSEETVKRMEVEHDLTRREVQVLQQQGRPSDRDNYTTKLKAYCESVQEEKNLAESRLHKAKKVIRDLEYELDNAKEDNVLLRERIRQNREHINVLRSPGGPLHIGTPKTSPTTPQHYRTTPKHTPTTARSIRQAPGSARPFEALLLADAVLSQENNSAPSTPIMARRPDARTPNKHHRGAQSLSSLPTTPQGAGARPATGNTALLPPVHFTPEAEARVANGLGWGAIHAASRERRRKSRDSTISAEDAEAIAAATRRSFREESEEIQESQASQSATEMLRIDPRESFEVAASRTTTPIPGEKASKQGKIYGSVTKSVTEKRKLVADNDVPPSAKKLKAVAGQAIGLGIGLDTRV